MSNRIAVMNAGRIEQVGTPADVYERPATPFVSGFVGVSNVLERDGKRVHRAAGEGAADRSRREGERPAHRAGADPRRLLRGDDHALPGRAGGGGGELQVVRQNLETSSAEALEQRGREVTIGWRPEHTVAVSEKQVGKRGGELQMSKLKGNPARIAWLVVGALVAFMLAFAGCGGDDDDGGGGEALPGGRQGRGRARPGRLGRLRRGRLHRPEGRLGDRLREADRLPDVNVKVAGTSDEMVDLMRTGEYDGVSASGNASLRLVEGGDVDPVNTDLVPNYETVFEDLKDQPYNTVRRRPTTGSPRPWGEPADVEHGRGQAGAEVVVGDPRPEGGVAVQGQDQRLRRPDLHRGRRGVPEGAQPDLGIENPYELDEEQFNAAIDLLKQQRRTWASTGPTR